MHNLSLPHLLHRLKKLKTLIVWGREDAIVPISAGDAYQQAIIGSQLHIIEQCGHRPEVEKTTEFVQIVSQFLKV
jgi:pimeloyl-ACP methyl ester carboxylesterase